MAVDVALSWNLSPTTASEVDGQRVYRSTTPSPTFPDDYSQIDSLAADTTTYDDTTPPEDTDLTYAVTAFNDVGESDASVSSTFVIQSNTLASSPTEIDAPTVVSVRERGVSASPTETDTIASTTVRAPNLIRGTVTDAGDPVEGAVVTAVKQDADADLSTTPSSADALAVQTEADGTYEFAYTELFAGVNTYHVIAHADDPERNGDVTYAYVQAGGAL